VNPNRTKIIGDIVSDFISDRFTILFEPSNIVYDEDDKTYCEGWFNENKKEVVIAIDEDEDIFLTTLTHEYCHYRQWKENSDIFNKANEAIPVMTDFLLGNKKRSKETDKAIDIVQEMELECEMRTSNILDKYYIGIKDIIPRANAYIYFYTVLKETGKWYKKSPLITDKILQEMPKDFQNIKAYRQMLDKLKCIYQKYCY
jgi:hypothetical protein